VEYPLVRQIIVALARRLTYIFLDHLHLGLSRRPERAEIVPRRNASSMLFLTFFLLIAVANLGLGYATYAVWRRHVQGDAKGWRFPFARGRTKV
jgi:hypothetical protein